MKYNKEKLTSMLLSEDKNMVKLGFDICRKMQVDERVDFLKTLVTGIVNNNKVERFRNKNVGIFRVSYISDDCVAIKFSKIYPEKNNLELTFAKLHSGELFIREYRLYNIQYPYEVHYILNDWTLGLYPRRISDMLK